MGERKVVANTGCYPLTGAFFALGREDRASMVPLGSGIV